MHAFQYVYSDMDQKSYELWYSEAENDFQMGEILYGSKKYNGAVFYFVQSAEKSVKALLYFLNLKPWGHSILNILKEYEK